MKTYLLTEKDIEKLREELNIRKIELAKMEGILKGLPYIIHTKNQKLTIYQGGLTLEDLKETARFMDRQSRQENKKDKKD